MKVLITGARGFVGQNLIQYFSAQKTPFETISLREGLPEIIQEDIHSFIHLAGLAHDVKKTQNDQAYDEINFGLTKELYDRFLQSSAHTFIFMSSVKAVSDEPGEEVVTELMEPQPLTAYGKSKRKAEIYLLEHQDSNKRLIILRPCMIHGPKNKGNLNLLVQWVKSGFPYPLGSFYNERSYLGIEHLCYVIHEFVQKSHLEGGIYHVADSGYLSTSELIQLIGRVLQKEIRVLNIPQTIIRILGKFGDVLGLPLNSDRLQKLTGDYRVSNDKLRTVLKSDRIFEVSDSLEQSLKTFVND